jgi:YVTN family beta-propeller protein
MVGGTPQTVAFAPDGTRAYVAVREGAIAAIDVALRRVVAQEKIDSELFGVAADGASLFVTAPASARLYLLDPATLRVTKTIATEPYPRGVAAVGSKVYVTHFRTGRLSVINASSGAVEQVVETTADSDLSQSVCVRGGRVYLPQTRANSANRSLLFATTVFPVVAVIDAATGEHLARERFPLDILDQPVNMPLDAIATDDRLFVVNSGSDDVTILDLAQRRLVAHVPVGSNPRGIALSADERTLYVNNTLSGTISVIDVPAARVAATIDATRIPLPPHILNGKILFNTSSRTALARDRWISCATCHFDGGADGRTWFFRDGPRNTTALFGVHETLPMHWSGDLDELEDVENTVRTIQAGTGLATGASNCDPSCDASPPNHGRAGDLDDLAAFMRSLRPSPQPPAGDFNAVTRGRALFFDARTGCAACHSPPLFTDRRKHDVGTGHSADERKGSSFDTPSLRGVFDTAPYLHDGSAATLLDVLRGATGQHGNTAGLAAAEHDDLVAFLRSLPVPQARRRAAGTP